MNIFGFFSNLFGGDDNNNNIDYDLGGISGGFYAPGTTEENLRTQNEDGNEIFDFEYDNQGFLYTEDSDFNDTSIGDKIKNYILGEDGLKLSSDTIEAISGFAKGARSVTKGRQRQQRRMPTSPRSRSGSFSPAGRAASGQFSAQKVRSDNVIASLINQSQRGSDAARLMQDRLYREAARERNQAIIEAITGEGKPEGPNITGRAPAISITSRVT